MLAAAAPGQASTGGAAAPSGSATTAPPFSSAPAVPRAPIVARNGRTKPYRGPVYELNASGQLLPQTAASSSAGQAGAAIGGVSAGQAISAPARLVVPGSAAVIIHGLAAAPESAPVAVQSAIWAANALIGKPYVYGGGHASFRSQGYDCSGTVSYALHGGGLLSSPLDSGEFETWGAAGQGTWITILTNPGHAYVDIAGIRLDTSAADDPSNQQGPRWRPLRPSNGGFALRHPLGL
jgi:cell wall-associated NlpC family hydrolase